MSERSRRTHDAIFCRCVRSDRMYRINISVSLSEVKYGVIIPDACFQSFLSRQKIPEILDQQLDHLTSRCETNPVWIRLQSQFDRCTSKQKSQTKLGVCGIRRPVCVLWLHVLYPEWFSDRTLSRSSLCWCQSLSLAWPSSLVFVCEMLGRWS